MIDVVSVASEAHPLIKTGGLADVTGALPAALAAHDVTVRTLLPGYPAVMGALEGGRVVAEMPDFFGGFGRLLAGRGGGLDIIAIDAPHLYDRPGNPYVGPDRKDWPDNWKRFAGLSFAAYEIGRGLLENYRPDVLHCHDWQAGLTPAYVAFNAPTRAKTVMTVHNIAFQGRYEWSIFNDLRIDFRAAQENAIEYFGGIGFLKAGLQTADALTTVSPTYALEIKGPAYGMGLEGLLQVRAEHLTGILNGIDIHEWDPMTDLKLVQHYSHNSIEQRAGNRQALAQRFGLDDAPGPMFSVVSRLTWQKGLDMLVEVADDLVAAGGKLIVLGSGDAEIENGLAGAAMRHPGKVGFVRGYDEPLSHLIQGGADVMLVPSRFEPCGLTQLYGLRYGCVPLVSRVGGLADTVIDANEAAVEAGVATGIVFAPATVEALREAIRRTARLYGRDKVWRKMQRRGMKSDVSWELSAEKYAKLYRRLLGMNENADSND
ncbi:MAG: glycogen synthase GlgA [Devosia nanyangense]|uniref:Glycogen synthase n=1 Tax=Devosia nanyangense TaxID=1228055 RepID=A0A933NUY3_9HYPH|nr:glycogen synthase GlgA [Devosia nanyangense]